MTSGGGNGAVHVVQAHGAGDGGAMAEELFWFVQSRHQHQPSMPIHTHLEVTAGSQSQGFPQLPGDRQLTL